jgi:hypothetical protein
MDRENNPEKKGDENMLVNKKGTATAAKNIDVLKAIRKSNKKHSKMMRKLAE